MARYCQPRAGGRSARWCALSCGLLRIDETLCCEVVHDLHRREVVMVFEDVRHSLVSSRRDALDHLRRCEITVCCTDPPGGSELREGFHVVALELVLLYLAERFFDISHVREQSHRLIASGDDPGTVPLGYPLRISQYLAERRCCFGGGYFPL